MQRKKRKLNFASVLCAFRDIVLKSIGIEEIEYEEFYMFGWWISLGCLTVGFSGIRQRIDFLSVYTIFLSIILIFLLIVFGKISGKKQNDSVVKSEPCIPLKKERDSK